MNPHFEKVGREFVTAYYGLFDSNRANLAALYVSFSLFCLNIELKLTVSLSLKLISYLECHKNIVFIRFLYICNAALSVWVYRNSCLLKF